MQFIDEVTIHVRGGSGGSGSLHWKRAKFVPQGGPDGGDGGKGGAVILQAVNNLNTLVDLMYQPHIWADDGLSGGENLKTGADGSNKIVSVPVGTQVYYNDTLVADLSKVGSRWVAARGGIGGKGNAFFKSSTNQAPEHAQPGVKGEERTFRLLLKSIADVGLIGLPNAGKSTFVRSVSAAKPKVANYPFTTLSPELGVVFLSDNRKFVLADIPGIIEGAHEGKGLGLKFLKHIERTKALIFVIDITQCPSFINEIPDIEKEHKELIENLSIESLSQLSLLKNELESFSENLLSYPSFVLFSKKDYPLVEDVFLNIIKKDSVLKNNCVLCSSHSRYQLDIACEKMWSLISIN